MAPKRQPRLTNTQRFIVDRCLLHVHRVLTNLDVVEPKERACLLAAVARGMGVSRQAVSKRYRHAREQRRAGQVQPGATREV